MRCKGKKKLQAAESQSISTCWIVRVIRKTDNQVVSLKTMNLNECCPLRVMSFSDLEMKAFSQRGVTVDQAQVVTNTSELLWPRSCAFMEEGLPDPKRYSVCASVSHAARVLLPQRR